jgi:hypothetical protein
VAAGRIVQVIVTPIHPSPVSAGVFFVLVSAGLLAVVTMIHKKNNGLKVPVESAAADCVSARVSDRRAHSGRRPAMAATVPAAVLLSGCCFSTTLPRPVLHATPIECDRRKARTTIPLRCSLRLSHQLQMLEAKLHHVAVTPSELHSREIDDDPLDISGIRLHDVDSGNRLVSMRTTRFRSRRPERRPAQFCFDLRRARRTDE